MAKENQSFARSCENHNTLLKNLNKQFEKQRYYCFKIKHSSQGDGYDVAYFDGNKKSFEQNDASSYEQFRSQTLYGCFCGLMYFGFNFGGLEQPSWFYSNFNEERLSLWGRHQEQIEERRFFPSLQKFLDAGGQYHVEFDASNDFKDINAKLFSTDESSTIVPHCTMVTSANIRDSLDECDSTCEVLNEILAKQNLQDVEM